MKTTDNVILITGGGSGIGRGLAEAFHKLGNQVIISGRRKEALDEVTGANPGMQSLTVDMEKAPAVSAFAAQVVQQFPGLNVLINNAGVMHPEDVQSEDYSTTEAETIVNTNLLGPIRLTAGLLPHLRKQHSSTIMMVSSGLAFVPMATTPTYCATKAAIHSYAQSLRYQLKKTGVEILELIPPYVATDLMGGAGKHDDRAMPLDKFIAEVMDILKNQPTATEICVENVKPLRFAAENGSYDRTFLGMNDSMAAAAH